ncbi:MAG: HPP family protein [Dehalococcoidia bacterium]
MASYLFDKKIKRQFRRYAAQVSLAAVALFGVLWAEQLIAGPDLARAVVIGAIAATACVLFISPHREVATPRHVLGGYAIGLGIASGLGLLMATTSGVSLLIQAPVLFPFGAAMAVGGSMFAMAATDTEHPPAVGTALAVAGHGFSWDIIAFVVVSVVLMAGLHRLVRHRLIDLY